MSRALATAGLGAAGATVYLRPELARDWARDVVFGPSSPRTIDLGPVGKELESLQRLVRPLLPAVARRPPPLPPPAACSRLHVLAPAPHPDRRRRLHARSTRTQVEDLSRQVAAGQRAGGSLTVVHTGQAGAGSGTYLLYSAAACGLGTVVYLRLARGWTFGDMLYATRRGLRDGLAQVSSGAHSRARWRAAGASGWAAGMPVLHCTAASESKHTAPAAAAAHLQGVVKPAARCCCCCCGPA